MDNYIKKHLQDIITAIEEIESFFENQPKLFEEFNRDLRLRRAVERSLTHVRSSMLVITSYMDTTVCLSIYCGVSL